LTKSTSTDALALPPLFMRSSHSSQIRRLSSALANSVLAKGVFSPANKQLQSPRTFFCHAVCLILLSALCCSPARANNVTWNGGGVGGGNYNWNDAANWNGATPSGTPNLTFAGNIGLTNPANSPTFFGPDNTSFAAIGTIKFSIGAGAFVIGGNAFTVGNITNSSTSTETIDNNLTLSAADTWAATSGDLVFNGTLGLANNSLVLSGTSHNISVNAATTLTFSHSITNNLAGTGIATFSDVNLAANTLTVKGSGNTSITGTIADGGSNGSLTYSGTGTLTLTGANTYTGATTVSSGTLQIGNGGTSGAINSTSSIVDNSALVFDRSDNISYSTVISGTGTLTQNGTGTLTLSGLNTYTGATTINGGILSISADNNLGTAPGAATANKLNFGGGTLETTSGFTLNQNRGITINAGGGTIDTTSGTLVYDGIIAGTGVLTKSGTGTLTLNGAVANTYSGGTAINAGTVNIGQSASLGTGTATFTGNSTLQAGANNLTVSNAVSISSGVTATVDTQANTTTLSGVISGAGALTMAGTGTLVLNGAGTNTFTGGLNLNAGTVQVGADKYLGGVNNLTFNGGTLEATNNFTLGANHTLTVSSSGGALKVDSGFTLTLATANQLISGGSGNILTLNGAGTLAMTASQDFSSGEIDLAAGSILSISGAGTTLKVGTLHITGNATIDFSGTSILDVTALDIDPSVTSLTINGWADTMDYFYAGSDPNGFNAGALADIKFGTPYSGDAAKWLPYNDGPISGPGHQITPVPEPATYGAIFTAAALGLFFWFRVKASARRLVPVRVAARY
jgi:fibronectin-binding autotransporter adhesin